MPAGPARYSPEFSAAVCARIAGGESMASICASKDMPSANTMYKWLGWHKDFAEQYARARKTQSESGIASRGRPSGYSPALATALCERIISGKTLRAICRSKGMPHVATLFRWLAQYEEFAEQYALAKEIQAEVLADEILDIADDPALEPSDKRVRIDTRKWLAAKMKPKKYGDRTSIDVGESLATLSDEEIERRIRAPLAKGAGQIPSLLEGEG